MQPGGGLAFPSQEPGFEPDYVDFGYYAFTIAVAAQTADVSTTTRDMRGPFSKRWMVIAISFGGRGGLGVAAPSARGRM